MIGIEMLPARYGDSLLVEYGHGSEVHRLLVDGGVTATYTGPLRRSPSLLPRSSESYTTPWRSAAIADAHELSAVYGEEGGLAVEIGRATAPEPRRAAPRPRRGRASEARPRRGGGRLADASGSELLGGG